MNTMRRTNQILILALAVAVSIAPSLAAKKKSPKSKAAAETAAVTVPANALSLVPGSERLADESYARLVAGEALRQVDPKILYQRMTTASQNGENYKALYFARILTARMTDNAAAWTNRAQLAESLGLTAEAQASRKNAENPAAPTQVSGEVLPGMGRMVAPSTLADWAAAMSLMADDLSAKVTPGTVVSVKDNLFGTDVVEGPSGAETKDRPLLVHGIVPNTFAMTHAEPMNTKHVNVGALMAGIFAGMSGLAGSYYGDANLAARGSELYGKAMAHAVEVDSTLEGGRYKAHVFPGGDPSVTPQQPKPSGKFSAVDWPVPVLFASGKATSPFFEGRWEKRGKSTDKKVSRKGGPAKAGSFKAQDLSFLRLAAFRNEFNELVSAPVTAFEVMLSVADMDALGGPSAAARRPNLEPAEKAYSQSGRLVLDPFYTGRGVVGIAKDGSAYSVELGPRSWVVTREVR
jgi:hypothetical protein